MRLRSAAGPGDGGTPLLNGSEIQSPSALDQRLGNTVSAWLRPRRAALHLRISLDREMDGLTIDRQRTDCRQIAETRGWQVVNEYVDQSRSANDKPKRRPGYDALVRDFDSGNFDAIMMGFGPANSTAATTRGLDRRGRRARIAAGDSER